MSREKFLLVSLQEDKAKKLAQVITNDTCRKILDYLADKEGSESKIAKILELPISTVHYNLKQLVDGGLVVVDEFHYSKKGKEINHYKLANKYIIIVPKSTHGIKEKLKSLLPAFLIVAGIGFILQFINGKSQSLGKMASTPMIANLKIDDAVAESASIAPQIVESAKILPVEVMYWILMGSALTIILYLGIEKIRSR